MKKLNVRCCCLPETVFGTLQVPDDVGVEARLRRVFQLDIVLTQSVHDFKMADALKPVNYEPRYAEVRHLWTTDTGVCKLELAVYSDDRPIEFWRTVRGFVEGERV